MRNVFAWFIGCGLSALLPAAAPAQDTVPGGGSNETDRLAIPRLLVGDPAPALAVSDWVKGGPVSLEKGKVYILDFWATWCAPCMASMPHSSALAAKYRDQGVMFIAITTADKTNTLEKVRSVVKDKGDGMDFVVAFDDGRKTTTAYRDAARRSGIPVCFVIDRSGKVAWVGHPMELDQPLAQIVAGSWDAAPARKAHQEALEKADLEVRLLRDYEAAKKAERWDDAVRFAEEIRPLTPRLGFVMGDTAEFLLKLKDSARANAYAKCCLTDIAKDDGPTLGRVARAFAEATDVPGRDLDLALKCAERATDLTGRGNCWSPHSVALVLMARGEREKAIALQRLAAESADDAQTREYMEKRLPEFEGK